MAKRGGKGVTSSPSGLEFARKEIQEAESCLVLARELERSGIFESSLSMMQQATEKLEQIGSISDKLYGFTVIINNLTWLATSMVERGVFDGAKHVIASLLNSMLGEFTAHQSTFDTDRYLCKCYVECLADCSIFLISVDEFEQALNIAERGLKAIEDRTYLVGTSTFGRCVHCRAYSLAMMGEMESSKQEYVRALRVYVSADDLIKTGGDDVVTSITKHVRSFDGNGGKKNQKKIISPKHAKKK